MIYYKERNEEFLKDIFRPMEKDEKMKDIKEVLRELFPYGHEGFIPLMLKHIEMHSNKNYDYAHGGHPLGNFTRVANILAQYPGLNPGDPAVVAMIYMLKQLDAALWLKANKHEAIVQGINERWDDVSVYANLIQLIEKEQEVKNESK